MMLISKPTRKDNILDLVLTNNGNLIRELEVDGEFGNIEPRTVRFSLDWAVTRESNPVLVPEFRTANYEGLRKHLRKVNCGLERHKTQAGTHLRGRRVEPSRLVKKIPE